jgi:hypothetical protein
MLGAMPDRRRHRGLHPEDRALFSREALPGLRAACTELSWLLDRGYPPVSSLKLVGDRHQLTARQRSAVSRAACADSLRDARAAKRVASAQLRGVTLQLDGFNVLTTLEVALGGGVVLGSRDGTLRDIAGVHGSYRRVQETEAALRLVAAFTRERGVEQCVWLLDRPVSNSGRLRSFMEELAATEQLAWSVELVPDPDRVLIGSTHVIASADGEVLDGCTRWHNLTREIVDTRVPDAYVVDLS